MANQYPPRYWDTLSEQLSCSDCKQIKPYNDFHKDSSNKYGYAYYCKTCACERGKAFHSIKNKNNPLYKEKVRRQYLKRTFGITQEEFLIRFNQQNGKCSICGTGLLETGTHTHIDHCHATGVIRGILCTNCNRGIGHFKDNPLFLREAANYLERHNNSVDVVKEGI